MTLRDQVLLNPETIMNTTRPMLSICCLTFNHEKFIRETLQGFVVQRTSFQFEIIVHDDASTDRTPEIISEYQSAYPDLFRVIFQKENQFSQGVCVPAILYSLAKGKYIAICEGDDYWIDPLKLQKQVDFLESHPGCTICCHKVIYHYENNEQADHDFPDITGNKIFDQKALIRKFFIKTCSAVFRNVKIQQLIDLLQDFKVGDTPLWFFYSKYGDIGFLDETMAVYRIHGNSYWSSLQEQDKLLLLLDTYKNIVKKLHIRGNEKRFLTINLALAKIFRSNSDIRSMRNYLLQCYKYLPFANSSQIKDIFFLSLNTR